MLAKLQQDQFRLKQVQSTQRKAVVKATMLGEYVPYIEGVLSAGQGAQDDVLGTIMVAPRRRRLRCLPVPPAGYRGRHPDRCQRAGRGRTHQPACTERELHRLPTGNRPARPKYPPYAQPQRLP
nr:phage terminase small subunit [Pseudomonas sp. NFPP07]